MVSGLRRAAAATAAQAGYRVQRSKAQLSGYPVLGFYSDRINRIFNIILFSRSPDESD